MKRSKFTEPQIAFILRQAEEGTAVGEVCRKAGISEATYYNWRKKYAGLTPSEMKRLRQHEEENGRVNDKRVSRLYREVDLQSPNHNTPAPRQGAVAERPRPRHAIAPILRD